MDFLSEEIAVISLFQIITIRRRKITGSNKFIAWGILKLFRGMQRGINIILGTGWDGEYHYLGQEMGRE